jgi:hypothetical protein
VADLTGQPYLAVDRGTADALAVIAEITPLLYDVTLDHVPNVPARPVEQLAQRAAAANAQCDEARYALASGLASAGAFSRLGARRTATTVLAEARAAVEPEANPTGEAWHFGPANVAAWSLAIAVEQGDGPSHAERLDADPVVPTSAGRRSRLHLDLARGYAQAEGSRDNEAIRHLDTADRIAPTRIRNDPIARDLVLTLDRRARRRVWELDSLANRFGIRSARS